MPKNPIKFFLITLQTKVFEFYLLQLCLMFKLEAAPRKNEKKMSNLQKDNILGVEEVKYKINFGSFVRSFVFLIILQAPSLSHMTLTLQKIPIGSFNLIAFELKGPYSCSYVLISFLTATAFCHLEIYIPWRREELLRSCTLRVGVDILWTT